MVDVDLEDFNRIRLRAVPQDGRVSEEIERCERKKKKKKQGQPRGNWGGASLALSPVPLLAISLSPVLPNLDSTDLKGTARSL